MKKKSGTLTKTKSKILITGGTGFLGTHIVRQFLDAGEKNLRVMASSVPEWMKDEGVEAAEGSVTNETDVAKTVKDVEAIYHLAGKVSRDNNDAMLMNRIHVQGTRILCQAAKESNVKTFILASSSGTIAISKDKEVLDETYPPPIDLILRFAYYSSKFYQEKTALENFNSKGSKLVILNPSLLLGSEDERLSSTKLIMDFLARKIHFTPSGGLNFVDARDAASAFIKALDLGKHKEKYLLGAENMSFTDFFGRLERLSGISAPMVKLPQTVSTAGANLVGLLFKQWNRIPPIEAKEIEQAELFWYFNSSKAKENLDFDPRSPQETLNDTIKYLRENFLGKGIFE